MLGACEPINLERSADVRFGAHNGLKSDIAPSRKVPNPEVAASFNHLAGGRQALMAEMIADRPRQPLNSLTSRLNFSGFSMNMKCAPPSFSSKISVFAPLICFPIQT